MTASTSVRLALATPLLLGLLPRADGPVFEPAEESVIRREITTLVELALDSISIEVDGEDREIAKQGDLEYSNEEHLVVIDTVSEVGDGRMLEFEREFAVVTAEQTVRYTSPEGDSEGDSMEPSSRLDGRTILFTWDEDDESYFREFSDDDEEDDVLLEGLIPDLDFLAVLPDGDVAEGDEWDLDEEVAGYFLWPGGRLHLLNEEEEVEPYVERGEQHRENLEANGSATLVELRETDDETLWLIEFELEAETWDESDDRESWLSFELEGELLWDGDEDLAREWRIEGTMRVETAATFEVEMFDETREVVETRVMEGPVEQTAVIELE